MSLALGCVPEIPHTKPPIQRAAGQCVCFLEGEEGEKGEGLHDCRCFFGRKKKSTLSPPPRIEGGPESAKFVKGVEKVQNRSIKEPGNAP